MAITVRIADQTTTGERGDELELDFLEEQIPARELIRRYVYERVAEHNARRRAGNATELRGTRGNSEELRGTWADARAARVRGGLLDWEQEFERAVTAFQARGILLLVDGRQVDDLEAQVELHLGCQVTFLRLLPLMGG